MIDYKSRNIRKVSDGSIIDLTELSPEDAKLLHYKEEKWIADRVKTLPPFSSERQELLNEGYELAILLMGIYLPQSKKSNGANMKSIEVVCRAIEQSRTAIRGGVPVSL